MPEKRKRPVCPECGGSNITFDASAAWDEGSQTFEAINIFDEGHTCEDCGAEVRVQWEEIPDDPAPKLKQYTVAAIYKDNRQRFATSVEAKDPEQAEELAREEADGPILVAGVFEGQHPAVDSKTFGEE